MFRKSSVPKFDPHYYSLIILLVLLGLNLDLAIAQSYTLVFDSVNSPPAVIPTDPKHLVYSVPLNQLTSLPIIAYIKDNTGGVVTSLRDTMKAYVTSMDKSQKKPEDLDSWRNSGGKLCQWSNPDKDWPHRFNRALYSTACGSNSSTTTLIANILNGKIIVDWLMHVHAKGSLPGNERFLKIEIPDLKLSNDTNLFKITEPAASLKITKQPPVKITANNKFAITANILDNKGAILTVGLDSVAFVELTVPYQYKRFYQRNEKNMLLESTKVRLGGPFVITNQASGDLVIRQRAVAGRVSFTDVRILDTVYNLKLNLTMFMSKNPFLRIPNCAKCYLDLNYKSIYNNLVRFQMPPSNVLSYIPSVVFTQHFEVIPQTFAKLKYINPLSGKGKMSITRNFPIPGPIMIEIQDANGNRINTGPDSMLKLTVETGPRFVCLSSDSSAVAYEGIAEFIGSICDIKSNVILIFFSNKLPLVNAKSQPFETVGNLNIGHFDHFEYTGGGVKLSPHINSFIRFAVTDVNNGKIPSVLPTVNMKLIVQTVETKDDLTHTIQLYNSFHEDASQNPSKKFHVALLSGNRKINSALARDFAHEKITLISLDEKEEIFTDFHLFNRVCWNSKQIFYSFLTFCKARYWVRMTILKTTNTHIPYSLFRLAHQMDIYFEHVIIDDVKVQWKSEDPDVNSVLSEAMQSLKSLKNKVIICFANHTQIPAILYIARKELISPSNGYQWIFVSEHAWAFPFNNTFACKNTPECTVAFKGSMLFTETYNTSFLHTEDWERVLTYYYSVDKSMYFGLITMYPNAYVSGQMALAYDAIWLYAAALTRIISNQLTVTMEKVTEELRKVTIQGLSGTLKLNQLGDRDGFHANIRTIEATAPKQSLEVVAPLKRYIKTTRNKKNIEYVYEDRNTYSKNVSVIQNSLPKSSIYNVHKYMSKSGRMSPTHFHLVKYNHEPWPSEDIVREEIIIPPFTCSHPCGLKGSKVNINEYDTGMCISTNRCKCNSGYFGANCTHILCNCTHGHCNEPYHCTCDDGYLGNECTVPICSGGCLNGECISPNKCKCYTYNWVGKRCHIHIAAILIPFFLFLTLFIYFGYIGFISCRKRIERAIAFSNLEWLVDWQEARSSTSIRSMTVASTIGNTTNTIYAWKKRKWFVKKINSYTIDQDDERVRIEMLELISVNHINLITYGGACLTHPDVCFLVELTQKGSLEDILLNETLKLGWNFRYSFMKDICRGMDYLHSKTNIGSHGRLKSSNCLVDNQWCIRITDFGAPTIRYGPYLIEKSESQKQDEYNSIQASLLWTAPELLEKATYLNDVRMGTKEGDVYSFGIVVSEIATRDVPFAYERRHLSTSTLLGLIVNRNSPRLEKELELWKSLRTGSYLVRPHINQEFLPEGNLEKNRFLKMLDEVWVDNPLARISFKNITTVFDNLYPTKEELAENLIYLLESYSKNLEVIVIEKTDALDTERTKVENIVKEMLPKKVIEQLKNGKKVEPENFESVTVYYSNIIDFTIVAKNSQPSQIVNLLNNVYRLCDNILAKYDVCKVDSVGNTCVVSSGVPTLNKNLHAGEIASASLDIMSAILTMETPYLPTTKLQLRLGINTGPVIAGVVGLKMPRYTLIGETMHIAAIMECTSNPMHIQMTEYTVKILKELGGYFTKFRMNRKLYGKNVETYWLIGKKGYEKPLPVILD